jgi:hypothetical protein
MTTDTEVDEQRAAHDLSDVLTAQFWGVVNADGADWAKEPHAVAWASAALLLQVLIALTISDRDDVAFGLKLIAEVERQFVQRTAAPAATAH